jgi:hypothetical protein
MPRLEHKLEQLMMSNTFLEVFLRGKEDFAQVKNPSLGSNPSEAENPTRNSLREENS